MVVTYSTCYTDKNGKHALLPIDLGNGVSFNTILVLPTFHSWKFFLGVTKYRTISDGFHIEFPIVFQSVYSGLSK